MFFIVRMRINVMHAETTRMDHSAFLAAQLMM